MKAKEFKDHLSKLSLEELKKEEASLKEELFRLRTPASPQFWQMHPDKELRRAKDTGSLVCPAKPCGALFCAVYGQKLFTICCFFSRNTICIQNGSKYQCFSEEMGKEVLFL